MSYFEKNYVGELRPNGQRRTPRFPIALWDVNERTLSGQERTNNAQEGWHRRFATIVTCHHPTTWKAIDSFKAEQATSNADLNDSLRETQVQKEGRLTKTATSVSEP